MGSLDLDIDFDDVYWSSKEKQSIANDLYNQGYMPELKPTVDGITDAVNKLMDFRSFSEFELGKLIHSLITNRCFITSDQIARIKEIIE